MTRLKDFDQNSILLWWAEALVRGDDPLSHVAKQGRIYQIEPKDLGKKKLRRHIPPQLRRRDLIPRNRAPNNEDYLQAAETFLERWFNQAMN